MSPDFGLPSTAELCAIIEALHDNVAIVDRHGIMRWVSNGFEQTYNISREKIIGRTTYELEAERVFSPSVAALVLKTKSLMTISEVSRQGQYNIVTGIPIFDDKQDVAFVISYSVDLRYSRQRHEEYERISALLTANTQSKQLYDLCACSVAMRKHVANLDKIAHVDTGVLITGESGVGKNVVARLIHHLSRRSQGPLVEINCAGIPAPLLESELFGYESGAFSGAHPRGKEGRIALSDKGTLFLDEIGELPLELQAKLLQVIQEKQIVKLGGVKPVSIDFRLIAATNQDLEALVAKKRFRSDLFFRLNILPLELPPLRKRKEDILPLTANILHEMNTKYATKKTLSPEVEHIFLHYSWPGNIRELRNLIERLVIISEQDIISYHDLPEHLRTNQCQTASTLAAALGQVEKQMLLDAYETYGSTVGVAKALGISQASASRKLAKYRKEAPASTLKQGCKQKSY